MGKNTHSYLIHSNVDAHLTCLNQGMSFICHYKLKMKQGWFQSYKRVCLKLQIWKHLQVQGASGVKIVAFACVYDECQNV